MITVLICDDRRRVREDLTRAIAAARGVKHLDCVARTDELLTRYARVRADLVLIGTGRAAPSGIESARRLVAADPGANVVVFGEPDDVRVIATAIADGVRGYLRWDASRPEVLAALAITLANVSIPAPRVHSPSNVELTERELQVLHGMVEGKSNGEMGRELSLAENTIKTHARSLFGKLGARDRAHAVAQGFRRGFMT
ncbi:response regulator transcription factor [Amycolatopsis oliviviridis]|uniref:DNA-binding response regulator n=1 Tax=Amycolatopsis oliviviridis TaxID=1471590 RepID=A0ABQ3M7F6_9PSEU|nr:response regulator transcription factor [Amycolatopsis oliviviridis]GHH28799.1 DNA-binding response regulator [Amycolatopsis oliviviridis]